MPISEAVEKHENLISRVMETIVPFEKKKNLWNDDKFLKAVEDMFIANDLEEDKLCKIVADALFNLKMAQPEVQVVKKLIAAFPEALKCKNSSNCLPIEQLTFYTDEEKAKCKYGTKYISTLALEGLKHNVVGENMRGGLLCVSSGDNTLQRLSRYCSDTWYLELLQDLRRHKLLMKKDIVDHNLLYHSCIGEESSERFQYFVEWDHEALLKTTVDGVPLMQAVTKHEKIALSNKKCFKRCLEYSLLYYKHLLFLKDDEDKTALDQAIEEFGEKQTMRVLREIFTKEAKYPILHQVIVHQPKYYNLFLKWFLYMFHLRDENGRTPTQVMFSMNREFLQENPTCWINQSTDQLEEKDPKTTLRTFASVAYGMLGDLDLSYQILRKHPSVIDVILEQRENSVDDSNARKRNAEEEDLDHESKKKKDENMDDDAN